MKKQTVYWVSATAALLGIVSFFVYDLYKTPKAGLVSDTALNDPEPDNVTSEPASAAPIDTSLAGFPLKSGSRGARVIALQNYLNSKYAAGLNPDGIFGPKTLAAVKSMQAAPIDSKALQYMNSGLFGGPAQAIVSGEISADFYNKVIA